uniref:Theileria-specific conserved protein n=1 Tax=Theileria annulata TaxID=5874 RepID=A0A3B0N5A4_THEAN
MFTIMNLLAIIVLFIAEKCLADNIYFVMDLDLSVRSHKWVITEHEYNGIRYYIFSPSFGYEIAAIVYKGQYMFVRPSVEVVAAVFVYYVEDQGGLPLILIHSYGYQHTPLVDAPTLEAERTNCLIIFLNSIKEVLPDNRFVQERLKNVDADHDPFQESKTLNGFIFRVYKSISFRGETPKFKEIFKSTHPRPSVTGAQLYQKEERPGTSTETAQTQAQASGTSLQPSQSDEPSQTEPEVVVISDFSESDYEGSESDYEGSETESGETEESLESGGESEMEYDKPAKRRKNEEEEPEQSETIMISDSGESDEET